MHEPVRRAIAAGDWRDRPIRLEANRAPLPVRIVLKALHSPQPRRRIFIEYQPRRKERVIAVEVVFIQLLPTRRQSMGKHHRQIMR